MKKPKESRYFWIGKVEMVRATGEGLIAEIRLPNSDRERVDSLITHVFTCPCPEWLNVNDEVVISLEKRR